VKPVAAGYLRHPGPGQTLPVNPEYRHVGSPVGPPGRAGTPGVAPGSGRGRGATA